MSVGLRERKKQQTREAIIRAGLDLFERDGYQATTVSQIADAAEISRGTLFSYFPSKEDILFHDHEETADEIAAALDSRPPGQSALDAVFTYVLDNLEQIDERARRRRQLVAEDRQLLAAYRARNAAIAEVIALAVADDLGVGFGDVRPQLTAAVMASAFNATEEHRLASHDAQSREEVTARLEVMMKFLRAGLDAIR